MHDWDQICKVHGPLVWRTVYRTLNDYTQALDCYQDVLLEAFERTKDRPVDDWPSLLCWLSVRRAIDRLRQRIRMDRKVVVSSVLSESLATVDAPLEAAQLNELMDRICEELAVLPERQAEAFWLRSVEQMSYSAIAEHLDVDTNQVGVLVHRTRLRLRKLLKDLNPHRIRE
jgi:RNA polymerase sigma factor (sigma-70 family)